MARTQTALTVAGALNLRVLEAGLHEAMSRGACVVTYDLTAVEGAHLSMVDTIARLQLTARRRRGQIRLRGVGGELSGLLDLAGLGYLMEG